jgi:hypothetical protein
VFGESITVIRPGAPGLPDAQGQPIPGTSSSVTYDSVAVAPGKVEEQAEAFGHRSENWFTLYRRGAVMDIRANDLVTIRGDAGWQAVADARKSEWRTPFWGSVIRGTVCEVRKAS